MTKEEFKQIRQNLGLRGHELAKKLGESTANILGYETGAKTVPERIEKYLNNINNSKTKKND
tara:strand:- start:1490 stop:1675 length:186 start_codon:yes stop_codon:yes gene_type:complete